jgi:gas vesicle protein
MIKKRRKPMLKENQTHLNHNHNISGIAAGLFLGSMLGAVTMLFLAPQSGKRTRVQIQQKSIELRDQAIEKVEDAMTQVRMESKKLARSGRHKAKEILHQGQELVAGQLAHVSEVVETGKKSILGS